VALRYQIDAERSMVRLVPRFRRWPNRPMHNGNRFDTRAALYGDSRRAYFSVDNR
jgi:hypothetical protein